MFIQVQFVVVYMTSQTAPPTSHAPPEEGGEGAERREEEREGGGREEGTEVRGGHAGRRGRGREGVGRGRVNHCILNTYPLGRAESQKKLNTFTLEQSVVCQQLMSGSRSHYYYKPLIL